MNIIDELRERGYLEQVMFEESLKKLVDKEKITFYLGIDPTADSLHIGHFIPMMVISHLQKAGHKPIILLGAGTAVVGDPSDRNDMRQMMSEEQLAHNASSIKKQIEKFASFEGENGAILLNNADWLKELNLLKYMREIGVHFNVNKMLAADCYKTRLKSGLTFFEMSYMTLQAYDFKYLHDKYNCKLQIGGNDQWSNVIAGADLIRKTEKEEAYAIGIKLLTKSDGTKMGKTMGGALWLDKDKISPYEFYQYFINVDDEDVETILRMLTFLPLDEIKELVSVEGSELNEAKRVAAFEITKLIHGEEEALKAQEASEALFGEGYSLEGMPEIEGNIGDNLLDLSIKARFGDSRGQIKTLIKQGGLSLNDNIVDDLNYIITEEDFENNIAIIKKGKKIYCKIIRK